MKNNIPGILTSTLFIFFCILLESTINPILAREPLSKGKLFVIGGGSRPEIMIDRLIAEANIGTSGYAFILPMASEKGDSAIFWSGEQFMKKGVRVVGFNFQEAQIPEKKWLDSLQNASLIYISGGDQARFMKVVSGTPVFDAIHQAYKKGAVIAGTSAGAAVMSKMMITGNELLHSKYNETFKCIEAGNIEYTEGLGLLSSAVVDQHFVVRSRYNRLITSVLEHPDLPGIGIDEATAILVSGNKAEVVGNSQVIVFRNTKKSTKRNGVKMGTPKIQLEIYLPGDQFLISKSR
jgi:cyanophycinase